MSVQVKITKQTLDFIEGWAEDHDLMLNNQGTIDNGDGTYTVDIDDDVAEKLRQTGTATLEEALEMIIEFHRQGGRKN